MDPYREWLGIDEGGGPMTAYRLLGLRPFEADPQAIRQAIARARRLLEPHQRGRSAGPCRQLLDQVARVEKVLTDPARKQSYDHGLRAKLGDSAGSVGGTPAKGSGGSGRAAPAAGSSGLRHWWSHQSAQRQVKLAVAVVGLAAAVGLVASQVGRRPRYPKPSGDIPQVPAQDLVPPRLPPPPAVPSIGGLPLGQPRPIPGLDGVIDGYSPCLSWDLNQIVFAAYADPAAKRHYDLYRARREHPDQAFHTPERLAGCSSALTAAAPALSPDGTELVFARCEVAPGDFRAQLFYVPIAAGSSARSAVPIPVPIPGLAAAGVRQDLPQFLGTGLDLVFRLTTRDSAGSEDHRYLVAHRAAADGPFAKPQPFPVDNPRAINFISADGLRSYMVVADGIQVCCRAGVDSPFSPPDPVQILGAKKIGPIDGPIWIAPQEDILFYCSPGLGRKLGSGRQLWMVRFR